jgi:hypothetical protein
MLATIHNPRELFELIFKHLQQASGNNSTVFFVLIGVLLICGGVYAFAGQRTYKPLLMSSGLLLGAIGGHILFELLDVNVRQQNYAHWGMIVTGASIGLFFGPRLIKVTFFVAGGSALTLLAYPGLQHLKQEYILFLVLLIFVAGGTLALLVQRFVISFATSVAGAYVVAVGAFSLGLKMNLIQSGFHFSIFYVGWGLLAVIALITQMSRKPSKDD